MPVNTSTNMTPQNSNFYQLELTKKQFQKLSQLLPAGFSLEPTPKTKVEINPQPTKKIFMNDGTQVTRKPTKPAERPSDSILINKNALRDPGKRKISSHLEFRYADYEPTATTSSKSSRVNQDAIRKCHNLLQKIKRHPAAGPFLFPVDVVGLGLTDYYDVIAEPMDLSTVETKLKNGAYDTASHFTADIRKIWNNAFTYNMKGTPIYLMTAEMSSYFEKNARDIEHVTFNDTVRNLEKQVEMLSRQITEIHQKGLTSVPEHPKMSRSGTKSTKSAKLSEKPLTQQEKKMLTESITKLPAEYLRGVRDIVSQVSGIGSNQEEFEICFDTLPVRISRELERYVKNKMSLVNRSRNKNKGKDLMVPVQTSSSNLKHQEVYNSQVKLDDDQTTRHHSMVEEEKNDYRSNLPTKADASPSNSSESSFISDSDSDGENEGKKKENPRNSKSLQTQQELADFLAGGHGSMLNSFIVK